MKYYDLMFNGNQYGNKVDSAEVVTEGLTEGDFCRGKRVENFNQRIVLEYTSFGDNYIMFDDLANVYNWQIISKRTKEVWPDTTLLFAI